MQRFKAKGIFRLGEEVDDLRDYYRFYALTTFVHPRCHRVSGEKFTGAVRPGPGTCSEAEAIVGDPPPRSGCRARRTAPPPTTGTHRRHFRRSISVGRACFRRDAEINSNLRTPMQRTKTLPSRHSCCGGFSRALRRESSHIVQIVMSA